MTTFLRLLKLRRFLRSNQYLGMTVKKSDWGKGWIVKHTLSQWSLFTIYIDQFNGYLFCNAIPDINRGIDVEDEKLIIHTDEFVLLHSAWCAAWSHYIYGPPQTRSRDTWEGKMLQSF